MRVALIGTLLLAALAPATAALDGPGPHTGVVIFDRWDACYLCRGPHIWPVSERVKESLRPYARRSVVVDATDVWQPMNPGPALLRDLRVSGEATEEHGAHLTLTADMRLLAGRPEFRVRLRNLGPAPRLIYTGDLGLILIARRTSPREPLWAFDGPSIAYGLDYGSGRMDWPERGGRLYWRLTSRRPSDYLELAPGQQLVATTLVNLPPGEFQFLACFGESDRGGRCLASSPISVDVDAQRIARQAP